MASVSIEADASVQRWGLVNFPSVTMSRLPKKTFLLEGFGRLYFGWTDAGGTNYVVFRLEYSED